MIIRVFNNSSWGKYIVLGEIKHIGCLPKKVDHKEAEVETDHCFSKILVMVWREKWVQFYDFIFMTLNFYFPPDKGDICFHG